MQCILLHRGKNRLFCSLNIQAVAMDIVSGEISLNLLCQYQGKVN